jgi:hypothetical protein
LWLRQLAWLSLSVLGLEVLPRCQAVTIVSGPSFTAASNAPLAGVVQLTTDVPSRVAVSVSDGTATWERNFYDYGTNHSLPLYGFKPGHTNHIAVTVNDRHRAAFTAASSLTFITAPLPSDFPVVTVLASQPEKMEPGYTLFRGANNNQKVGYVTFVDNQGQVVWYSSKVPSLLDVRQLNNGDLFVPSSTYTNFVELNLLGLTVNKWTTPTNLSLNYHDAVLTDHGTILYINDQGRLISGFPSSATDSNAPTQTTMVQYNQILEMSATNPSPAHAPLLHSWSLIDMLNPLRISYLTFTIRSSLGWDCEHANAVLEDPRDNSIIVSMRHQNAVIKFSRSGQLKWILGPPENWGPAFQPYLLTPVGSPFAWNYGQHAPMLTPQGTLLLYDDGNFRASPFDSNVPDSSNYSRAVEYDINEQTMEVTQVWEYGGSISPRLFTPTVGNAEWLDQTGNILIMFGNTTYVNGAPPSPYSTTAAMVRVQEVTHAQPAEVVFDLALWDYNNTSSGYQGCFAYRAHRVPDLYGHPAMPVADLDITFDSGLAHLSFSADPFRSYTIQASTDLVNWAEVGTPDAGPGGTYDFNDPDSATSANRYYRVVTQ